MSSLRILRTTFTVLIFASLLQGCVPLVATGAATGIALIHDRRGSSMVIEDQGVESKAARALKDNSGLYERSHVNFTSYNNVVLITGEAASTADSQKIGSLTRQVPHVKRIINELGIGAPTSLGSRSKDTWITTKIKSKMTTTKNLDPIYFKTVTERGIVYLFGLVKRKEAERAAMLASKIKGVRKVVKLFEYKYD